MAAKAELPAEPPKGQPALRTLAMPADANPNGDIFGGWVLSQMDVAGGVPASELAAGRIATVAIDGMRFHQPIYIGDLVSCYAEIIRVGTTSITVHVQTWARRRHAGTEVLVTEGTFVYVAIDEEGRPRKVSQGLPAGSAARTE
jgi:acyl-CoA thioesterase YciA